MIHPTSARWPSEKEWNDELPKMLAKHKRIRTSIAEMKAQKDAAA
jgi:hypothetical protein